jgi:FKBP-type peptidyl-prolyl cis-trans isomerase
LILLTQKKPIEFKLGQGQVIEGWDEGGFIERLEIKLFCDYSDWDTDQQVQEVIPPNAT